jgi:hypothetical protein
MAYLAAGKPQFAQQSLHQALRYGPAFAYAANARAALEQIAKLPL